MHQSPRYRPVPPKWATRFLRWYCHADLVDKVEGDLYELFQRRVETQSLWKAKAFYWLNVLMFLHPYYIGKRKKNYTTNHTAMFKNHFKVALRNLLNKKVYATINILGLSIGIACCLLPMVDLLQKSAFSDPSTGWGWTNFITYVQLYENADLATVAQKFTKIVVRNREEEWRQTNTTGHVNVQPLQDVHLNADLAAPREVTGNYQTVYFFSVIGLVILLIALVNYTNLTTARAFDRAREVGVRKVVGARRGQLMMQFLTESALVILIAFALAVAIADVFRPALNKLTGLTMINVLWMNSSFWASLLASLCLTTLLAGLYPAFVLSSFQPVVVLKGRVSKTAMSNWLRRGLVVFQFTASIALLIGITVLYTQISHMRNRELGMNLEQILTVDAPRVLPEGIDHVSAVETFTQELSRLSAVGQIATSAAVPGKGFNYYTNDVRKAAADPSTSVAGVVTNIDTSFAALYGMKLVAGNGFKNMTAPPEGEPHPVIINETAAFALGFVIPEDAINQEVDIEDNPAKNFVGTIALSFLLASPLDWYIMNQWLQDFAYRIHVEWWMFAISGTLVLLIALITVSFQSIKAALANPVDSLRNE